MVAGRIERKSPPRRRSYGPSSARSLGEGTQNSAAAGPVSIQLPPLFLARVGEWLRTDLLAQLIKRTLSRCLIRPPSQQFCPMSETAARDMVEPHFDDQIRTQRFPFAAALRAPAAGSTGGVAGETGRLAQCLQLMG